MNRIIAITWYLIFCDLHLTSDYLGIFCYCYWKHELIQTELIYQEFEIKPLNSNPEIPKYYSQLS